jgi:hypothetical protein
MVQLERNMETQIRDAFLRFMCTCFYDYKQYLCRPNQLSTDASSLFKLDDFLGSRNSSYRKFYLLVTNTQMFTKFIAEHSLLPSNALN